MQIARHLVLLSLLSWIASAQKISIGGNFGVNLLTDRKFALAHSNITTFPRWDLTGEFRILPLPTTLSASESRSNDTGTRFSLGPSVDFAWGEHWAFEVTALTRRPSVDMIYIFSITESSSTVFRPPVLIDREWQIPALLKYGIGNGKRFQPIVLGGPSWRFLQSGDPISHVGGTIGGGIRMPFKRLIAEPTLRYTRWASSNGRPDQLEFQLSIRYLVKR